MRTRTLAATVVGAALALGLSVGTYATWTGNDKAHAAPVTSGALTLSSDTVMGVDGPVWMDTSVPGSPVVIDPATFLATAGDQIRMGHYFTLAATGDNLTYELNVRWNASPAITEGVTATYTLTENPGTAEATAHVVRAPLGTPLSLPAAGEGDRAFLLDIDLAYAETRSDRTQAEVDLTDIGQISITADQIRQGV